MGENSRVSAHAVCKRATGLASGLAISAPGSNDSRKTQLGDTAIAAAVFAEEGRLEILKASAS
jgi:hypothetical protein